MAVKRSTGGQSIPVPNGQTAIIMRGSEAYEYKDQKRTNTRATDEQGRPVTRLTVFGPLLGSLVEYTIEAPDVVVPDLSEFDLIQVQGPRLSASVRGGDYGQVSYKVTGAEKLSPIGSGFDLFSLTQAEKG